MQRTRLRRVGIGLSLAAGLSGCGGRGSADGGLPGGVSRLVAYAAKDAPSAPPALYLTDVEAGGARRVASPVPAGQSILVYAWSADHRFLAYQTDLDVDGDLELYVVTPGVDEDPGRLVSDGHVSRFVWSSTGADLAFLARDPGVLQYAGHVLRDGAAAPVRLTPPPSAPGGGVGDVVFAPDGSRIAFTANLESAQRYELFTVRLDATGWVKVSGPALDLTSAYAPRWSPDSTRLAWTSDATQPGRHELHANLAAGGDLRVISGPLVAGGDVSTFVWSPTGERLAFRGDLLQAGVFELFVTDPLGVSRMRVSGPMATAGLIVVGDAYGFAWSPDGTRLAYTADQDVDEVVDLYVTDAHASDAWIQASGAHPPTAEVTDWAWSPASDRLLMRGDFDQDARLEAFTVAAAGGPRVRVSGPPGAGGGVYAARWSEDGTRVLFGADFTAPNTFDLFSAPASGGLRTNLSDLDAPGFVRPEIHEASGGRIVFVGDLDSTGLDELWSVAPDGTDLAKLSGPLPAGGGVLGAAVR